MWQTLLHKSNALEIQTWKVARLGKIFVQRKFPCIRYTYCTRQHNLVSIRYYVLLQPCLPPIHTFQRSGWLGIWVTGVWIPLPQLWPHGGTENDAHTHSLQCSGFDSDEPTQRYHQFSYNTGKWLPRTIIQTWYLLAENQNDRSSTQIMGSCIKNG